MSHLISVQDLETDDFGNFQKDLKKHFDGIDFKFHEGPAESPDRKWVDKKFKEIKEAARWGGAGIEELPVSLDGVLGELEADFKDELTEKCRLECIDIPSAFGERQSLEAYCGMERNFDTPPTKITSDTLEKTLNLLLKYSAFISCIKPQKYMNGVKGGTFRRTVKGE